MDSASKSMPLNGWPVMFEGIYFFSQNAERDQYQIFAHLLEVAVGFQIAIDSRNYEQSKVQVAKTFSWFCALLKALREKDLEDAVFRKYPAACPRCRSPRCVCIEGSIADPDPAWLHQQASIRSFSRPGPLHAWQAMFEEIYDGSGRRFGVDPGTPEARTRLERAATKLIWELAEAAEAMRQPLYPENLRAELADVFAWLCACVNGLAAAFGESDLLSFSELVWERYPDECDTCWNAICICQLKPMREMILKTGIILPSVRDKLTSLLNRGKFDFDFGRAIHRERMAALMMDCDHFKAMNDNWGHGHGDEVLRYISRVITSNLPYGSRAYRYGGDEFMVLLYDLGRGEVVDVALAIRDGVREGDSPLTKDGVRPLVSVTIGVAVEGMHTVTKKNIVTVVDAALYEAKKIGRGNVAFANGELLGKKVEEIQPFPARES